ncbi:MAG: chromosome segregation protein SMC [Planctomycetes bacterium]|nr:chromosome segregation protein SMC [Planctomycetota bacterium]
MILRLQVQGFKNLRDVDVRFGPLTCLVGPNGVGKSNLFDAIQFLRHLANHDLETAAAALRQPGDGGFQALDLVRNRDPGTVMRFVADLLVPGTAVDDFGQPVSPTASLLTYTVGVRWSVEQQRLVLVEEELRHHIKGDAKKVLLFPHATAFRDSVVLGARFGTAFLSTHHEGGRAFVQLHGDGGGGGKGRPVAADASPRTILGGTGSAEFPTVVAARREMASWHGVHFELSALRAPDCFGETAPVDECGRHVAATLHRLGRGGAMERLCAEVGNQLARFVEGVHAVRLRDDDVRQQHVVEVRFRHSDQWLPPRALSEGTLRLLALIAMRMDEQSSRLLCVEEPENGVEPEAVPHLIQLFRDHAVDAEEPVAAGDNPLRQVVLVSHSREVVRALDAADVLFVESCSGQDGMFARVLPVDYAGVWRPDSDRVPPGRFKDWIGDLPRGQTSFA